MKILIYILRLIGSILLVFLAALMFLIATPIAFIWKVCATIKEPERNYTELTKSFYQYFTEIAAGFDQLGNAAFGGLWNWLFLLDKSNRYAFGDKDETISEVLGWNLKLNTLSSKGIWMVKVLNKLDKNHCLRAYEKGVENAKVKFYNAKTTA